MKSESVCVMTTRLFTAADNGGCDSGWLSLILALYELIAYTNARYVSR